jgi:hypothetical protein
MSNAAAVIGIVLFAFFLTGVTVGIIAVIAVSARRGGTAARRTHPARPPGGTRPYRRHARARRP